MVVFGICERHLGRRQMKLNVGLVLALAAYVFWGVVPIFWRQIDHVEPMQIVAHRMLWSFVLVTALIFILGQGRQLLSTFKDRVTLWRLFLASCFVSINWAVFIWAVNSGYLVETAMGYFINPLISVVFGIFIFKERLRRWQMLAIAIATIGVLVMVVAQGKVPWIALSLAVTFTLYSVMKKRVSLPATHGMSIETMFFVLPALAYLMWRQQLGVGSFGNGTATTDVLLVLGGLLTLIPLTLFAAAAKRVTLITLGMCQYIGPTLQFLIAVFLYQEALGGVRLFAFCCIWLALIVYSADLLRMNRSAEKLINA